MKQIYIQAATQTPKNIQDEFSAKNPSNIRRNSNRLTILSANPLASEARSGKPATQGGTLCKGPPGRPRSPGMFPEHPPDGGGITPDRVSNPVGGNTPQNTEIQIFKNNKFNFYSQSNFTTMKKHLFILILAVFAYTAAAFGQVKITTGTIGTATSTCTSGGKDSPLNPKPGKPYSYSVNIQNSGILVGGQVSSYSWWATKNQNFIKTTPYGPDWDDKLTVGAGGGLISATSTYGTSGGTETISITWSPSILALTEYQGDNTPAPGVKSPTFVAVMANGACSNNIQVYEIDPMPAFTVDITNYDTASSTAELYGTTISECVSQVVSATYNRADNAVDMDYGSNYLLYEVVSANFVGSWTATITVDGLSAGETASVTIFADKASAIAGTPGTNETLNFTANATPQVATSVFASDLTDTSGGVSFWLGVTIDHNEYETIAPSTIKITVGGMDSVGNYDLFANCDDASDVDGDDFAEQIINPRPDVGDTTNDPLYNATDPDTFIPKQ